MKHCKKWLCLALCAAMLLGLMPSMVPAAAAADNGWKYGLGDAMGWNESTYYTIAKRTSNNNWREALASANGEIAFLESGDPDEDVFIFNNTKIVYDDNSIHEVPDLTGIIDEQRAGAINYNRWVWNQAASAYDQDTWGISGGRGMVWSRPYQPAAQYRIKNNDYTAANKNAYNRYTNYETAEVGAQWRDNACNEWNRRSFASRADDVIVTYIEAPAGKTLNLTITMDHLTDMRNEGTVNPLPASDYVVTQEGGQVVGFGTVAKYATRNIQGSKNQDKTLFSYGGWASATRIVLGSGGSVAYNAATRTIASSSSFGLNSSIQASDPRLTVTGTNSLLLITKVDRQDDGCQNVNDIRTVLYDRLQGEIAQLVAAKGVTSTEAGYQSLLAPHAAIHGGMFNNVRLDLCQTEAEKADRALTNSELIAKQNSNKTAINKAFLERIYNNGRYGLICAHGYGSTRLGAIWCGTWNPSWSGDYTLDANTNLQISGLNTGNMAEAGEGYINFILRMVADWEINAQKIYGMEDAILAPPRVDGTGQGQSYHYGDVYPHVFVNGITDWLLLPIFEYWQCYGNQKITLGKDIDPARNQSVLDWTDADVARIRRDGYLDLEQDILYPMAIKAMNFWTQLADERYYTDGSGKRHVNDGTTLSQAVAAGDENARYIFAPGFSPENTPRQGDAHVEALAYNVTMDIAAAHDSLYIARTMLGLRDPGDPRLAQWDEFEKRIPDYLYEPKTGELKEWASEALAEAHRHRHESHAYAAWPGYDAQDDEAIREGLAIAMDRRSDAYNGEEATESHGATHKALVEARLKRPVALERVVLYLVTNGYQYSNMLTSHNRNKSSCLCTDSAFGLMGAVNESLLFSNTGVIEILPTLLPELGKGSITGLRARNNTQVDLAWDRDDAHTASVTLTTDEASTELQLLCGLDWDRAAIGGAAQKVERDALGRSYITVQLTRGKPVTVDFSLATGEGPTRDPYGVLPASSYDSAKHELAVRPDGGIGVTEARDAICFERMDFGGEGSTRTVRLTLSNDRTSGGLNRDGSSTIKLFTTDPDSGAAPLASLTLPNTGGKYRTVDLELPSRLLGVQDIYIKFQDGGCILKSVEFTEMPIANVADGERVSISAQKPLVLSLNTESYTYELNGTKNIASGRTITTVGDWTLLVRPRGSDAVYKTIVFSTYVSAANQALASGCVVKPGEAVSLTQSPGDASLTLWLAPAAATKFAESSYMTSAPGTASSLTAPKDEGAYVLTVVDASGAVLSRSDAAVRVRTAQSYIDFTDRSYEGTFEIVGQDVSAIREGQGLYMVTTKDAFEPANGQLDGSAATTPRDLVLVPVVGDWTATLAFDFSQASASNGYYQFFGFYAMRDYNNCVGIRGGDGAMQDFRRIGGEVTAETMNSQPGLSANGAYWYRIEKQGTSYTCYRSSNGENFEPMFAYENTGIEAGSLAIDAYTGMTTGYEFYLKSLDFGSDAACQHAYEPAITAPTCTAPGCTTYTCVKCGDTYSSDELPALGHAWDEGRVTRPATATEEGIKTYTCTRCGETKTEVLPPIPDGPKECPSKNFTDVPGVTDWAHAGIDYCVENGLMKGTSDTLFSPKGSVTRAQLVTILYRVEDEPTVTEPSKFTDVPAGQWYSDAIAWAAANGIVTGMNETTFAPMNKITREQIATILYRYTKDAKAEGSIDSFPDASKVSGWAKDPLTWAVAQNLITGVKNANNTTTLNPTANATRAQIASIIMRYLEAGEAEAQ